MLKVSTAEPAATTVKADKLRFSLGFITSELRASDYSGWRFFLKGKETVIVEDARANFASKALLFD